MGSTEREMKVPTHMLLPINAFGKSRMSAISNWAQAP